MRHTTNYINYKSNEAWGVEPKILKTVPNQFTIRKQMIGRQHPHWMADLQSSKRCPPSADVNLTTTTAGKDLKQLSWSIIKKTSQDYMTIRKQTFSGQLENNCKESFPGEAITGWANTHGTLFHNTQLVSPGKSQLFDSKKTEICSSCGRPRKQQAQW